MRRASEFSFVKEISDKFSQTNKRDKNYITSMSKKETDAAGGLTSSAGLSTYYDAEKENLSVDPRTVIGITILMAVFFTGLNLYYNLALA